MIRFLFFCLLILSAFTVSAQNNILLLRKHNKTFKTLFEGKYIAFDTKQKSYASGIITKIGKDTIYIRHFEILKSATEYGGVYFDTSFRYTTAIHIKDIGAIHPFRSMSGYANTGFMLMIAGGGVMVLGAVNGIYRKENIGEWYKPSGFISAGVLAGTGYLLRRASKKKYVIGKKYQLKILSIN
jgi:hypothetical protein